MTDLLPAAAASIGGEHAATRTRVVLDTSVLIADPSCVTSFDDVDVVIPLIVVEELDGLKTRPDDVGRAARTALRAIEELRVRHGGSLAEPVPVGGTAACRSSSTASRSTCSSSTASTRTARTTASSAPPSGQAERGPTTMVSNDAALRIKAAHLGVAAAEHLPTRAAVSTQAAGWSTIETTHEIVDCLYAAGALDADAVEGPPSSARTSSPCCAPGRSRR